MRFAADHPEARPRDPELAGLLDAFTEAQRTSGTRTKYREALIDFLNVAGIRTLEALPEVR